jgi:hypothetical protein
METGASTRRNTGTGRHGGRGHETRQQGAGTVSPRTSGQARHVDAQAGRLALGETQTFAGHADGAGLHAGNGRAGVLQWRADERTYAPPRYAGIAPSSGRAAVRMSSWRADGGLRACGHAAIEPACRR